MTIEAIKDAITEQMNELDELTHVPDAAKSEIMIRFEDLLEILNDAQDEYGDEAEDDDPYGMNSDDFEG